MSNRKCPTCEGDGSASAMFDANCEAAWTHKYLRNFPAASEPTREPVGGVETGEREELKDVLIPVVLSLVVADARTYSDAIDKVTDAILAAGYRRSPAPSPATPEGE